jgi:hypothetical protein
MEKKHIPPIHIASMILLLISAYMWWFVSNNSDYDDISYKGMVVEKLGVATASVMVVKFDSIGYRKIDPTLNEWYKYDKGDVIYRKYDKVELDEAHWYTTLDIFFGCVISFVTLVVIFNSVIRILEDS